MRGENRNCERHLTSTTTVTDLATPSRQRLQSIAERSGNRGPSPQRKFAKQASVPKKLPIPQATQDRNMGQRGQGYPDDVCDIDSRNFLNSVVHPGLTTDIDRFVTRTACGSEFQQRRVRLGHAMYRAATALPVRKNTAPRCAFSPHHRPQRTHVPRRVRSGHRLKTRHPVSGNAD